MRTSEEWEPDGLVCHLTWGTIWDCWQKRRDGWL